MFEIDHSIPVPASAGTKRIYPFSQMEIGDSVFIPNATHDSKAVAAAKMYFRRSGKKMTAKSGDGGVRIWRVA